MSYPTERLFQKFYYDVPSFVDGTTTFHSMCGRHIRTGTTVLEIGPGACNPTSRFLAGLGSVIGVDVSREVMINPWLRQAYVYDGRVLPFANSSFAACVSDYVLEHIQDPAQHLREVARVLRPGGVYCFRTPNLWHYVALASRLLPHFVHLNLANPLRGLPPNAHDPYRTAYRANTRKAIERFSAEARLEILEIAMVEKEPSYGRLNAALFLPMLLYERVVNNFRLLSRMRANIFAVLGRPS